MGPALPPLQKLWEHQLSPSQAHLWPAAPSPSSVKVSDASSLGSIPRLQPTPPSPLGEAPEDSSQPWRLEPLAAFPQVYTLSGPVSFSDITKGHSVYQTPSVCQTLGGS